MSATFRALFRRSEQKPSPSPDRHSQSSLDLENAASKPPKWSLGVLNDRETDEVPGSVILLSKATHRNEPLGLQHAHARTSSSSLPSPFPTSLSRTSSRTSLGRPRRKRTPDGKFVLDPQPDDSANDPLNWPVWRRNAALLSLGFYCMVGGGITPILAAGFNEVADTFDVTIPQIAFTTGLYMMGLGIGSVIMSPTAILFGKRPVYIVTAILFILASIWCALSQNYYSLLVARIFQGIAVSPVECLPSATVAEIFFLHERAWRLGIYSMLLLGGKNLVPLVSAVVIQSLGWRWVFWIVAMVVGFGVCLLFFFVPETFWDRTPRPKNVTRGMESFAHRLHMHLSRTHTRMSGSLHPQAEKEREKGRSTAEGGRVEALPTGSTTMPERKRAQMLAHAHVSFMHNPDAPNGEASSSEVLDEKKADAETTAPAAEEENGSITANESTSHKATAGSTELDQDATTPTSPISPPGAPQSPTSPNSATNPDVPQTPLSASGITTGTPANPYTSRMHNAPAKSYWDTLNLYSGRLTTDPWWRVAIRPFFLFAYPSILWSTVVYSLSVGWLIVLSESVAHVYKNSETYNFTSLQTGLVYLSPFVGGIMGTAVAGKVSDLVVRAMARRNDGVYEPEFRLVMALPIALSTTAGLMGFGWSAEERDAWIVPTVFFGVISFGCSLGSTTSITFAVDSYRQYAGEALVTLNFSKNIFHGLVFSLFFPHWLESQGSKKVFIAIGGIQLACMMLSVPMYVYGKRARMWTVRKNLMEKF